MEISEQEIEKIKSEAEQGDVRAQYVLGELYNKGQCVQYDEAEALKWYKKAADLGDGYHVYLRRKYGIC